MKRFVFIFAVLALLAQAAAAKPTLHAALGSDAKSLDPLRAVDSISFLVTKHINETLVTVDGETRQLVPVLAEKWEIPDPLTYVFYLKKGVRFHNGEELTADDVIYSFQRVAKSAKQAARYLDPERFEVRDRYTAVIRTKTPWGGFLESMKNPYASIFCRKTSEGSEESLVRNPAGTGPFVLNKWIKGERIDLTAFDGYHGAKPNFDAITFLVVPDDSSRVIALETGKADLTFALPTSDLERLGEHNAKGARGVRTPGLNVFYLGFNTTKGALADVRVRKAIDAAIDKNVYAQVVYQGNARTPLGLLVPASTFTPESGYQEQFDPAKARALLKEAGCENGLDLELWTTSNQDRINGATVIQSMLADVGIRVKVINLEPGLFYDEIVKGRHDLVLGNWGMQTNRDAGSFWASLLHSTTIGSTNWFFLNDSVIDEQLDRANGSVDPAVRTEALYAVWKRLGELRPAVALTVPDELYGASERLSGVENFRDGRINYLGVLELKP